MRVEKAEGRSASKADTENLITEFRGSTRRWLLGSFAGWGTLALCLLGVGLIIVSMAWWRNIGTFYQLTNQRLIIRRGVILKTEDEVELYRIKDVRVTYSIVNQLTGIGEITILSTDATTHHQQLVLTAIPDARELREDIRDLVSAARARLRVRELDLDIE